MASLIPTRPTLREEVEQEFGDLALEMVHCTLCGEYHPPEIHLAPVGVWDDGEEPAEA